MRRISSLHVVHSFDNRQGGVVHAALSVAKFLCLAGHPAEIIASYATGDEIDYVVDLFSEVPFHQIPRRFPERYYNAPKLGTWLEREHRRFDIVQIHSVWTGTTAIAARFCRRRGRGYFVFAHNSLDPFDLRKRALLKRLLGPLYIRPMLEKALGVISTTQREQERLITFGANPARFVVPLPAIQASRSNCGRSTFRAENGIPIDAFVVLFLSRWDLKKGLQFLIPALSELKKEHPKLWLVLAGSGESEFTKEVHRMLDTYRVRPWASIPGFLSGDKKDAAFSASDAFVLPSLNENFGIVVVEALRAGVPIVISNQVFLHPEVERANAGLICDPTIHSCAEAVKRLASGQVNRDDMVRRGKTLAADYFSPEAATERLLGVYLSGLAK